MKKSGSGKRSGGRTSVRKAASKAAKGTRAAKATVKKAAAKRVASSEAVAFAKTARKPAVRKWAHRTIRPVLARGNGRIDQGGPLKSLPAGPRNVLRTATRARPRLTKVDSASLREPADGIYLVRPSGSSAARALEGERVELNPASRKALMKRLAEFRNDTREQIREVKRWAKDHAHRATVAQGLISTGVVMSLSADEVQQLHLDLPGAQLIMNRPLSLISPVKESLGSTRRKAPHEAAWHLEAIGQRTARANGRAFSGKDVRIAVLDTGVERAHPELRGRVREAWRIRPGAVAVDRSDLIQDRRHADTDGHGTHVAGLICGKTVGVAPDATIASLLMMPRGRATTFDFLRCLDWAAGRPDIALVNFSAGETPPNDELMPVVREIIAVGVLPFFAVGNSGENNTCSPGNYPIGVSVGATNETDGRTVSSFSGSARLVHDRQIYDVPSLVAPGQAIRSSYRNSGYRWLNGTSMATPIACGIAACFIETARGLISPVELFDLLRKSCLKLKGQPTWRQGAGLVQVPA